MHPALKFCQFGGVLRFREWPGPLHFWQAFTWPWTPWSDGTPAFWRISWQGSRDYVLAALPFLNEVLGCKVGRLELWLGDRLQGCWVILVRWHEQWGDRELQGRTFPRKKVIRWKRSLLLCRLLRNWKEIFHLHYLLTFFKKGKPFNPSVDGPGVGPSQMSRIAWDPRLVQSWGLTWNPWILHGPQDFVNQLPETVEFCGDTWFWVGGSTVSRRASQDPFLGFQVR